MDINNYVANILARYLKMCKIGLNYYGNYKKHMKGDEQDPVISLNE